MYNSENEFLSTLLNRQKIDLKNFSQIDKQQINTMSAMDYRGFYLKIKNNKLYIINEKSSYELRNKRILEFIYFLTNNYKLPDVEFIIHTDDKPPTNKFPMFVQSKKEHEEGILYPDFSFIRWDWPDFPEASVENWEILRHLMPYKNKEIKDKIPKCLFRGANTNKIRLFLKQKSIYNNFFDIDISVGSNSKKEYIPLLDHNKYKYLLNLPGNSSSGRFKYLFLMNSVIFDIQGEYIEFWYHVLKNDYHYFKFPYDEMCYENISKKILELESDQEYYNKIIKNSEEIKKYFTYNNIIKYWINLLEEYSKRLTFEVV